MTEGPEASVDLYWLPLGAGGHSVRLNGKIFEAVVAGLERRSRRDLYHSALIVGVPEGRFAIERRPCGAATAERGVVSGGAVGSCWAGPLPDLPLRAAPLAKRVIPDVAEAVESPQRLTTDARSRSASSTSCRRCRHPCGAVTNCGAGEMWNSNSVISWLIARCGLEVEPISPPVGGRAPGWRAGIVVARRQA